MSTWFESWFDSEYYHLLYANRNEAEADAFISSICKHLNLTPGVHVLDLGCGKGRHSISLSQKGYHVLGVDLAKNSIAQAKKHESETLKFEVGDMRNHLGTEAFDAVFNVFTSFGYFDGLGDNLKVLERIYTSLKQNGVLVIDFMNAHYVKKHLVKSEEKVMNGVKFIIERHCDDHHFYKKIDIIDEAHSESHTERVQYIDQDQFHKILTQAGFMIIEEFGDYQLNPFDLNSSPRLIIRAKKG